MKLVVGALLLLVAALAWPWSASARPDFLVMFQSDPFRKADVDGCTVCHSNPRGGGPRNEFGNAFLDAGHTITTMMRANFQDRFAIPTTKLSDGSLLLAADPKNQAVVYEKDSKRYLVDLAVLTAPKKEVLPPPANRMTFFVTSQTLSKGGHLEGLAGADRLCQAMAEAAGAGDRRWRAYLSTSFDGKPLVNAGDRIGPGPWFNAKGVLIAKGVSDLHRMKDLGELVLTEKGERLPAGSGGLILTGSHPDGTAAAGQNCENWTSGKEGQAAAGRLGGGSGATWNSGGAAPACTPEAFQAAGGSRLYCFAVTSR